jgi:hypothetical protein
MEELPRLTQLLQWAIFGVAGFLLLRWLWRLGSKKPRRRGFRRF